LNNHHTDYSSIKLLSKFETIVVINVRFLFFYKKNAFFNVFFIFPAFFLIFNKKAELTLGLARDRTATWRVTVNLASLTAIVTV